MLPVFEICFILNLKCQKILTKNFARRSQHSLCSQSCFTKKITYFVLCVKKTKFGAKKTLNETFVLSFLHKIQEISVFRKTWPVHIECRDVHVKFLFEFFQHLLNVFSATGAYAPMCRFGFLL
jgi:hypothetical protein